MKCVNENVFLSAIMHLLFYSTEELLSMSLIHYGHLFSSDGQPVSISDSFDPRATLRCLDLMQSREKGPISFRMSSRRHTQTETS